MATNILKKVLLGNKKRNKNYMKVKKNKRLIEKGKVLYFPIQKLLNILSSKSSVLMLPVTSPR